MYYIYFLLNIYFVGVMKKFILFIFASSLFCLGGCVQRNSAEIPLTQLQVREIQTREFDTKDSKLVTKSMMNVLQDDGFILKNVVSDLGLISAEKSLDIEKDGDAFRARMIWGREATWAKQEIVAASANVSEFGNKVRVRVTFQSQKIDNFGRSITTTTILDSSFYQEFFEKVGKGIFIQQENI